MESGRIVEVAEAELAACVPAIRAAFATVAAEFRLTEANCPTNAAFLTPDRLVRARARGSRMFALRESGAVIGFFELSPAGAGARKLEKLAVVPEHRHRGRGRMLLDAAKAEAAKLGATRLEAGIIEENVRLRQWYLDNGFRHLGTRCFESLPFTVGLIAARLP